MAGKESTSTVQTGAAEEARALKEKREKELAWLDIQNKYLNSSKITDAEPEKVQEKKKEAAATQNKPAAKKSFWRSLGHKIFSGICALSTMTIGGLAWLFSVPFTSKKKKAKSVTTSLDSTLIPGSKKDKFDMTLPEKEDQPILSDKRRVPLVFEEPILEDPNAKPTITLNFTQEKEGRSTDLNNSHAFITLKYTKVDPVSGKPQRYKSTFGFYSADAGIREGAAQGLNGMYVPGRLENDRTAYSDIGIEYEVTNKQINQVVLAAQQYAAGGYNMIKRNCCTFVHDMGIAAGIDVDKFMQITDFGLDLKTVGTGVLFGSLALLGAPAISRIGRATLIDRAGKDDFTYQHFEQKVLNKEDIQRLSKMTFNMRMDGYYPSKTAENIRNMSNVKLNSKGYVKIQGYTFDEAKNYAGRAKNEIIKAIQKNPDLREHSDEFETMANAISEYIGKSSDFINGRGSENNKEMTVNEKVEALTARTKELSQLKENLNRFYLDKLKGDKKLNIPFQHMYAVLDYCQDILNAEGTVAKSQLKFAKGAPGYLDNNMYKDFINFDRDSSTAIKAFKYGYIALGKDEEGGIDLTAPEFAATVKVLGSAKNCGRYFELQKKADKTNAEKKEFAALDKRCQSISAFEDAEESFLSDRKFTAEDYKFAFVDLPRAEMEIKGKGYDYTKSTPAKVSEIYQTIAMEKVFPGLKNELKKLDIDQITKDPTEFKKTINDFLTKKFADKNNKELNKLQEALIGVESERICQENEKNKITAGPENYEKILNEILYNSHAVILHDFKNAYLKTVMTELITDKVVSEAEPLKIPEGLDPLTAKRKQDNAKRAQAIEQRRKVEEMLEKLNISGFDLDNAKEFPTLHDAVRANIGRDFKKPAEPAKNSSVVKENAPKVQSNVKSAPRPSSRASAMA